MTTTSNNSVQTALEEKALLWHVRLQGGAATETDWLAFTDWLEADPAHNDAYTTIALSWDEVENCAEAFTQEKGTETDSAPETDNIISFPFHKLRGAIQARPLTYGGGFGAAIAASFLLLFAPVYLGQNDALGGMNYETAIGEQRTITLADGSSVMLNTNSAITVRMDKKGRTIELKKGEAFFDVHHEKERSFIVAANDLNIRDIGTRFDVRVMGDRTMVSVTQGVVELSPLAKQQEAGIQTVRLVEGQQAIRTPDEKIDIRAFDLEQTTSWQSGYLLFEQTQLSQVVAELNRYFSVPIRLAGDDVKNTYFSGVLQISSQDRALSDIAALESLRIIKTESYITLQQDPSVQP